MHNLAAKSLAVRLTRTDNIVDELRTALTPAVTTYKVLESTNLIPIKGRGIINCFERNNDWCAFRLSCFGQSLRLLTVVAACSSFLR